MASITKTSAQRITKKQGQTGKNFYFEKRRAVYNKKKIATVIHPLKYKSTNTVENVRVKESYKIDSNSYSFTYSNTATYPLYTFGYQQVIHNP